MPTAESKQRKVPANIEAIYDLSPMQEGMLFHSRASQVAGLYVVQSVWTLEGPLDEARFQRAWRETAARHGVLRTCFVTDAKPRQVVFREISIPWLCEDWRAQSAEEQESALEKFLANDRNTPFDFRRPPLMRWAQFRLTDEKYWFAWTSHHALLDGWSGALILKEVFARYRAIGSGETLALPPAKPFKEYLDWLRRQPVEAARNYWQSYLGEFREPTKLPFAEIETGGQADCSLAWNVAQTEALKKAAARERITLNTLVEGLWALLLSRYSGDTDVLFGTANAGRPETLPGADAMAGLFVVNVPVRARIEWKLPLGEWLRELQTQNARSRKFGYLPLTEIQRASDVPASEPLFQSMVAFENFALDAFELSYGAQAAGGKTKLNAQFHTAREHTNFPLSLVVWPGDRLTVRIYAHTRQSVGERLLAQFSSLLEQFIEEPARTMEDYRFFLAGDEERLRGWNGAHAPVREGGLARAFERQVEKTPDAVAAVFHDSQLSYAALDQRSNQLARRLCEWGVGPETRVGLCLDRGLNLLVGLFGILKAGAAYVPLDPRYPAGRLSYLVSDARAATVVCGDSSMSLFDASETRTLNIESGWSAIAQEPAHALNVAAGDRSLAYIIYTSGSSGQPKGVEVEQASVVNLARAQGRALKAGAGSVLLQFASFSFDAAVWDWAIALLNGGTLVLEEREQLFPGMGLERCIERHSVTDASLPPSVLGAVSEPDSFASFTTLLVSAEACPVELTKRWGQSLNLRNAYGPTEATVCATVSDRLGDGAAPIGRPFDNVQLYVVGPNGELLPPGMPGELLIGGECLARGYFQRPRFTAERFVPDYFSGRAGSRLYRTGDRAQWREDGQLLFLGRLDEQVKLRGFRIEPGEIEAALLAAPGVEQSAVVVRDNGRGESCLAAFLTGKPQAEERLRYVLAGHLPEHMIPSVYVWLDALPLTPNGKLDRAALHLPAGQYRSHRPLSANEDLVASIWKTLLRQDEVYADSHFFQLGGHSLLAAQIHSRIRQVFGRELPLRTLFENPVLAQFTARLEEALRDEGDAAAIQPIRKRKDSATAPLSHAQQRLWFLEQLHPGTDAYHLPALLRLKGPLDQEALRRSFEEIVRRHEILRTVFTEEEGQPLQAVIAPARWELPVIDLAGDAEREQTLARYLAEEIRRPFDLAAGPLLRTVLVRLNDDEHVLLLNQHHIVSDGWSLRVLVHDLSALYEGYADNRPPALAELPVQYGDYAAWEQEPANSRVKESEFEFWRKRLAGNEPLSLPVDFARSSGQMGEAGAVRFNVPAATVTALRELALAEGSTFFIILLTSWQFLLARLSGVSDITVGIPVANRRHMETEALIGFFVNTLAMRARWQGDPTFRELLERNRRSAIECFQHQNVPLERLVDELGHERTSNRNPLFQTMLVLQDLDTASLRLGGLDVTPIDTHLAAAKFELTMNVAEEADGSLGGMLEYASGLWRNASMQLLAERWALLLGSIVKEPGARLSELAMVSEAERLELASWSGAEKAIEEGTVGGRFRRQAEETPDAVAVVFGDEQLSYGELEKRSNRLARHLRECGAGVERRVGLCVERGAGLIVGMLGILKAGAGYVPLDPRYPAERLRYLIEDARADLVVTESRWAPLFGGARTVCLDSDWDSKETDSAEAPPEEGTGEGLAYVIYTSGSSGRPKGVEVCQRSVLNLAADQREKFGLGAGKALLQFASFSFDAAVWDWALALLSGATLVMGERERLLPRAGLEEKVARHNVTLASLPPSVLGAAEAGAGLEGLETLIVAAEACPAELAARWGTKLTLRNEYGPTEATVCVTLSDGMKGEDGVAPIGRALANAKLYIVGPEDELLPPGAPGELWIGGACLARGYFGQPRLTAEKFTPNPFGAGRVYRTGDRARWRPDGQLEYLGRLDEQLKLRGFRIEPGEIENALLALPGVKQAAVALRAVHGEPALVAYLTGNPDLTVLRAQLAASLPEHFVPAHFMLLEALPLTPNGKLDSKSLPDPSSSPSSSPSRPRDQVELAVQGIWKNVLQRSDVGISEDFFALGGHSFTAVALAAQLSHELAIDFPVKAVFTHPTIERMALHIKELGGKSSDANSHVLPLRAKGPNRPLFCFHPAAGLGTVFLPLTDSLPPDQPVYALESRPARPLPTVEAMATAYLADIRAVQASGPYQFLGYSLGGLIALETAHQLEQAGETVSFLAVLDARPADPVIPIDPATSEIDLREHRAAVLQDLTAGMGIEIEPHEDLTGAYLRAGQRAGFIPPGISREYLDGVLECFAINRRAALAYVAPRYSGPVTLICNPYSETIAAWERICAHLKTRILEHPHAQYMEEPNVSKITEILQEENKKWM